MNEIERLKTRIDALLATAKWMEDRQRDPQTIARLRQAAVEEQVKLDKLTAQS